MNKNRYYRNFKQYPPYGPKVREEIFNRENVSGEIFPGLQGVVHNIIGDMDSKRHFILNGLTPFEVGPGDITVTPGFAFLNSELVEMTSTYTNQTLVDDTIVYISDATKDFATVPVSSWENADGPIICGYIGGTFYDLRRGNLPSWGGYSEVTVENKDRVILSPNTHYPLAHRIDILDEFIIDATIGKLEINGGNDTLLSSTDLLTIKSYGSNGVVITSSSPTDYKLTLDINTKPGTNGTYDIGEDGNRFASIYADYIRTSYVGGDDTFHLETSSGPVISVIGNNISLHRPIVPSADGTLSVGTVDTRFNTGYFASMNVSGVITAPSTTVRHRMGNVVIIDDAVRYNDGTTERDLIKYYSSAVTIGNSTDSIEIESSQILPPSAGLSIGNLGNRVKKIYNDEYVIEHPPGGSVGDIKVSGILGYTDVTANDSAPLYTAMLVSSSPNGLSFVKSTSNNPIPAVGLYLGPFINNFDTDGLVLYNGYCYIDDSLILNNNNALSNIVYRDGDGKLNVNKPDTGGQYVQPVGVVRFSENGRTLLYFNPSLVTVKNAP